jgi:hypothetical protein
MGSYLIPPSVPDARALRPGTGFHSAAEGREGEGRGRPTRKVRLMALLYRPRPEDSRPEEALVPEKIKSHITGQLIFFLQ